MVVWHSEVSSNIRRHLAHPPSLPMTRLIPQVFQWQHERKFRLVAVATWLISQVFQWRMWPQTERTDGKFGPNEGWTPSHYDWWLILYPSPPGSSPKSSNDEAHPPSGPASSRQHQQGARDHVRGQERAGDPAGVCPDFRIINTYYTDYWLHFSYFK